MFTRGQLLAIWAIVSCSRVAGAPALARAIDDELEHLPVTPERKEEDSAAHPHDQA